MVFITDSHKTKKDKITYIDTITYNGVTVWVSLVNGASGLSLVDLIKLSGQCRSYIYNVFNRNIYRLKDEILTGDKRSHRYLSLTGCIKLLSYMYRPDDGLIELLKNTINELTTKELSYNNSWLDEYNDAGSKFDEDLQKRYDEMFASFDEKLDNAIRQFVLKISDLSHRMDALENKKANGSGNSLKGLLKDVLLDALREE